MNISAMKVYTMMPFGNCENTSLFEDIANRPITPDSMPAVYPFSSSFFILNITR